MIQWNDYARIFSQDFDDKTQFLQEQPPQASDWSTDSRSIGSGQWYAPLQGPNFNGHNYIADAIDKGAVGFLYSKEHLQLVPASLVPMGIEVDSVLRCLQSIANFWRLQFKSLSLVGITGSVGKTTSREMLSRILSACATTLATTGNNNNEIGVPKTLLDLNETHKYAVIEMGARHLNDIKILADIAQPDVACLLNAGSAHLEIFGNEENLLNTKLEIYQGVAGKSTIVCPLDDDRIHQYCQSLGRRMYTFGYQNSASVAIGPTTWLNSGMSCSFTIEKKKMSVLFKSSHEAYPYNAAAALAIGLALGLDPQMMIAALHDFEPLAGRYKTAKRKGATFVDDTYNASPKSMISGLTTFSRLHSTKKRYWFLVIC